VPKEIENLQGLVDDIVETRRATAKARFLPRGNAVPPRILLEAACEPLAGRLATHGFRFSRSRLEFKRKTDGIVQAIKLKGSGENLAGHRASCIVEVSVLAPSYAQWTATQGLDDSEYLWSNQLGYLAGGREYIRWDFAPEATRDAEAADLTARIMAIAVPTLDAWRTRASIVECMHDTLEVCRADWLVQIALWAGGAEAGRAALQRGEMKFSSDPETLARLVRAFGLDLPIPST
jgi:hypothetical protein